MISFVLAAIAGYITARTVISWFTVRRSSSDRVSVILYDSVLAAIAVPVLIIAAVQLS